MKFFRLIKDSVHWVARVSEYAGWGVLLGWVALMTVGASTRYLFHTPLIFQVEVVSSMLVVFCCLCFTPVFLRGGHIRVDLVTRRLPQRVQDWLWLFAEFVTLVFVILIISSVLDLIAHSLEINAKFPVFKMPIAPFQIFIPVGFGLFAFALLVDFGKRLYNMLKG